MQITQIEAIPFRLPLKEDLSFATGKLTSMEYVLVRIHTETGLVGIGEAPVRPMIYGESIASIVEAVQTWFAPALTGLEHDAIDEAWLRLDSVEANACAKGAIDIALHDLIAKAAGVPLRKLLGGYSDHVELCHCIIKLGEPDKIAAEAANVVSHYGFRWLKLKAGHDSHRDTRMIAAVREAVGPDIHLTVDCNHGYPAYLAEKVLPRWRDFNLEWVEEPCPGSDVAGRARAAKVSPAPFMIDESAQTPFSVMEEIRRGVCRVVSIKVARTGIALSRKILTLCETSGLRPVVGGQGDTEIGALAAAQFGAASRLFATNCAELSFFLDLPESISTDRPTIEDGRLILPDTPGIGAQICDDQLQRYRIDR